MKKQRICELIGRVAVYMTIHASGVAFIVWAFTRMTVYKY